MSPQIKQLFNNLIFMEHLNPKEKWTWLAFRNICMNFLSSRKSDDYVAHVEEFLSAYKAMGCNMSLKVNFLSYTWTFPLKILEPFQKSMGNGSIKILLSSRDFQRSGMQAMLVEYYWSLVRETPTYFISYFFLNLCVKINFLFPPNQIHGQ